MILIQALAITATADQKCASSIREAMRVLANNPIRDKGVAGYEKGWRAGIDHDGCDFKAHELD
jgi:hypothetical protein